MCTSSVEKKFFVQSLLPLLSLFNYLHTALTYGVCALCAFPLLKKKKKANKNHNTNKTTTFKTISQVLN